MEQQKTKLTSAERSARWRAKYPERSRAANKKHRDNNPEYHAVRRRAYRLKVVFNMTESDYLELLRQQDYKCAICGTDNPVGKWGRFCVDHDHVNGKVRALLCNPCNRALGLFKDDPVLMFKAAQYVSCHKEKTAADKLLYGEIIDVE